jgi:hypothetical protein
MPGSDDDVERWRKISERQIAARDPSEARKQRYQRVQQRHKGYRKNWTMKDIVRVLSNKVLGLIAGIILGFIAWIVLTYIVEASWETLAGIGLVVFFGGVGTLFGAALDWRDDLSDF